MNERSAGGRLVHANGQKIKHKKAAPLIASTRHDRQDSLLYGDMED